MKLKLTTGDTAVYYDTGSCPRPQSGYILNGPRPLYFPNEIALRDFFANTCRKDTIVQVFGWMQDDTDSAILVCLNSVVAQLYIRQQPMRAVLAQALPLFEQGTLQLFVMAHLSQCIKLGMVSIQPLALLNSISVVSTSGLERLVKNNQRTMRKNSDIRIIRSSVDEDFFNMQEQFSMARFGISISADEEQIQHLIYGQHGFFVNTYVSDNTVIARNLCYLDDTRKNFYDLSLPWLAAYKKHRIGYFSIIQNLMYAHRHRTSYSLGGGNYEYKREIVRYFPE